MKKILTLIITLALSLVLVSCKGAMNLENDLIVVFYTDKGTEIPRIVNPEKGKPIARPADPEKLGYDFDDWYKDISFETKWNFETDTIEESTTIYAKYDIIHYDIIYHVAEGESIANNKLTYTVAEDVFLRNTIKLGYTFNGWYLDAAFTKKIDRISKGTTGVVELYSRLAFKVSFDSTYLAAPKTILVDPNTEIPKNSTNNNILAPTRVGYTFGGWYDIDTREYVDQQIVPPAENLVDFANKVITKEVTVYAYWIKN